MMLQLQIASDEVQQRSVLFLGHTGLLPTETSLEGFMGSLEQE